MSDIAKLLFEMRERPEDFRLDNAQRILTHVPSGQEFWVGLGRSGMWRPVQVDFSFSDGCRFRKVWRPMRQAIIAQRLRWVRENLCEPQRSTVRVSP